jgi:methionine sulfoxide reductase heme-binding subunit
LKSAANRAVPNPPLEREGEKVPEERLEERPEKRQRPEKRERPENRERPDRRRAKGRARLSIGLVTTIAALSPLGLLAWDTATGGLGVEPVEALIRRTGWWALTLLVATLAVTPLRRITGWNKLIQMRRPLGVVSFSFAALHFTLYVTIDSWFALSYIIEDIMERPFITAGFTAFLMLIPLAATSTKASIRRLGGKRWQRLHRLIYPAALLASLHYFWLVKADTRPPILYAAIIVTLLLLRIKLPHASKSRSTSRTASVEA